MIAATGFTSPPAELFRGTEPTASIDADLQKISGTFTRDPATGVTINSEFDKTVFGHWVQTQPGSESVVSMTYKLPFRVTLPTSSVHPIQRLLLGDDAEQEIDSYSLLIQRQSGKKNVIFNSTIMLPEQFRIVWNGSTDDSRAGSSQGVFTYSTELNTDKFIALILASKNP